MEETYIYAHVDLWLAKLFLKFLWVYLSQTEDNCWEAKSQWIENMLKRTAILYLILNITIKAGGIKGYMTSIGDRLGRQETAKLEISGTG